VLYVAVPGEPSIGNQMREEVTGKAGASIESVDHCEVALAVG
jgi:hypothetical protein